MYRFIFGFHRLAWWPKWTPASRSSLTPTTSCCCCCTVLSKASPSSGGWTSARASQSGALTVEIRRESLGPPPGPLRRYRPRSALWRACVIENDQKSSADGSTRVPSLLAGPIRAAPPELSSPIEPGNRQQPSKNSTTRYLLSTTHRSEAPFSPGSPASRHRRRQGACGSCAPGPRSPLPRGAAARAPRPARRSRGCSSRVPRGDAGVAQTVDPAGPRLTQGETVLEGSVAPVALESVGRMLLRERLHCAVAQDLGHDARRRYRGALCVGERNALDRRAELQVPVRQGTACVGRYGFEGPSERLFVRGADAVAVDPPGRIRHHRDGTRRPQHLAQQPFSNIGAQDLRVVQADYLALSEDHGSGYDRAGQSTPPGLVGAGQGYAPLRDPRRVERVEGAARLRTAPPALGAQSPSRVGSSLLGLFDAGLLAHLLADVVELRAANGAPGDHVYGGNLRRVQREDSFDGDAERVLAHGEGLADAVALAGDAQSLEALDALAVALYDPVVHPDGVPRLEPRDAVLLDRIGRDHFSPLADGATNAGPRRIPACLLPWPLPAAGLARAPGYTIFA